MREGVFGVGISIMKNEYLKRKCNDFGIVAFYSVKNSVSKTFILYLS